MLVKEKLNRYQKGITLHTKSREVRCLCGFPAPCLLFKLNDCISVSTISCGFDSIKSTIFIHIIQAIFFYQKYLGQKLVTLLC